MEQRSKVEVEKLAWEVCERGFTNLKQGRIEAALADLRVAIPLLAEYSWPLICLGAALLAQNNLAQAEKAFKEALRKPKTEVNEKVFVQALEGLKRIEKQRRAQDLYALANTLFKKRNLGQAIQTYTQAIALVGTKKIPWALCNRGYAFLKKGNLRAALADLRVAIPLLAEYAWPLVCLGEVFRAKNDLVQAEKAFKEALRKSPKRENEKAFIQARESLKKVKVAQKKLQETRVARKQADFSPVLLGRGTNQETGTSEEVRLGYTERRGGLYVLGQPRTGKTTLLISMMLEDIKRGHGLCFLDPHGDAIEEILRRLPDDRKGDVVLFDPLDDEYTFGINLFECDDITDRGMVSRVFDYTLQVFGKLFTESGNLLQDAPAMYETVVGLTALLVYNQNYTLAEVPLLLQDSFACAKLIPQIGAAHSDEKDWWERYLKLKPDEKEEISGSTRRRLKALLTNEYMRHIVGQPTTTLNLRSIMDERKILLVRLSREQEQLTSLVGSLIIVKLLQAAYSRDDTPESDRVDFCLYCDEFQTFATPEMAKLITETGKYHILSTFAHQERRGQFSGKDKIFGATSGGANKILFRTTVNDAEELAPEFARKPPPAEVIEREIRTPVSDVLGHLKNRGGHRNPLVNEFVHTYNLLDTSQRSHEQTENSLYNQESTLTPNTKYGFLFSRANLGIPFSKLIQTEEDIKALTDLLTVELFEHIHEEMYFLPMYMIDERRPGGSTYPLEPEESYLDFEKGDDEPQKKLLRAAYQYLIPYENVKEIFREERKSKQQKQQSLLIKYLSQTGKAVTSPPPILWGNAYDFQEALKGLETLARQRYLDMRREDRQRIAQHYCNKLDDAVKNYHRDYSYGTTYDLGWKEEIENNFPFIQFTGTCISGSFDPSGRGWYASGGLPSVKWKMVESTIAQEVDDLIKYNQPLFERFLVQLHDVLSILAADPILSGSGSYEHVPSSQRTFSDMNAEMANELVNLPRYTALAKIVKSGGGREMVAKYKLSPQNLIPPHDIQTVRQHRAVILRNTRLFCQERTQVSKNIQARRDDLKK